MNEEKANFLAQKKLQSSKENMIQLPNWIFVGGKKQVLKHIYVLNRRHIYIVEKIAL